MMKIGSLIAVAAMVLTAGAANAAAPSEVGYVKGELAVADIVDGRLERAEHVLAAQSAQDALDPARLINLGIVYAKSGRIADARRNFTTAGVVPEESLILSDGREVSSRRIAREQLALLDHASIATR